MKNVASLVIATCVMTSLLNAGDGGLDRVDQALTWADADGQARGRVSGTLDLEGYALPAHAPGVIDTESHALFVPRLTAFFDGQLGERIYLFAQARADRGFDPSGESLRGRLDEIALRVALHPRANLQIGKFATVVGNWTARHDSWHNPFITAPLAYEQLTGVWDSEPPHSASQLLVWSHIRPGLPQAVVDDEKYLRLPIVWGPSYATGVALAGNADTFRYAFEMKNASLSSRPGTWGMVDGHWNQPTFSGRVRYVPSEQWEFGWSASEGTFLRREADAAIFPPHRRSEYREIVLGQDVTYAWHHLQVWAEVYAARFKAPPAGNADTLSYYVEAKYKFSAQFFGAIRWSQQLFGNIDDRGTSVRWDRDVWRIDVAPAYRFTPNSQVKLQCSLQRGEADARPTSAFAAAQLTLRY